MRQDIARETILPAAGLLRAGGHVLPVRVYYEDTDSSGVVYHASYLRFFERGRTEYLRARGIHQQAIMDGAHGPCFHFAVARMVIDFRKPARMDDILHIRTSAEKVGGASIALTQSITRGEELLTSAKVLVACIAQDRPARIPQWVREKLV